MKMYTDKSTGLIFVAVLLLLVGSGRAQEECFTDPSSDACSTFEVSQDQVTQSLDAICKEESLGVSQSGWPTGCSMAAACKTVSQTDSMCDSLSLLLTTCSEIDSNQECTKYQRLCSDGTNVPACKESSVIEGIPSVDTIYQATINMCNAMPDMVGCETCKDVPKDSTELVIRQQCPNPLQSISTVCLGMWMTGCEIWVDFCKVTAEESAFSSLCTGKPTPSAADMGDMENTNTASSNDSCISDPTQASCADYIMPESIVQEDLENLCISMPNMVGCSFRTACTNGTAEGDWCSPFSLLGTICEEMSSMRDCSNYNSLCFSPGSVVAQCSTEKPIPSAPSTEEATKTVISLCSDHGMVGCEKCTSISNCPHPLDSLSEICLGMPYMAGCSKFFAMCTSTGDDFSQLCGTGEEQGLPPMRMWLHTGIRDIVLIKEWVPTNGGYYFGTLVACFFGAVLVQWLKAFRIQQELTWASKRPILPCRNIACGGRLEDQKSDDERDPIGAGNSSGEGCCGGSSSKDTTETTGQRVKNFGVRAFDELFGWCKFTKAQFKRNIVRSAFSGIVVFLDYMLMLIVMTFNIGIIVAVVFGYMVGALLMGHIGEKAGSITSGGATAAVDPAAEVDVRFMEPPSCCGSTGIL
jgi:copper transporter 1